MRLSASLLLFIVSGTALSAQALRVPDKYRITDQEKAACTMDAVRLCGGAYPNEDRLIACMRANHASLSSTCRVAFDEGVRRRRL